MTGLLTFLVVAVVILTGAVVLLLDRVDNLEEQQRETHHFACVLADELGYDGDPAPCRD